MSRLIRTATDLVKFLMLEKFCELYAEIETETEVTVSYKVTHLPKLGYFLEACVYLIQLVVDPILSAAKMSRTARLYALVPGGVQDAPSND